MRPTQRLLSRLLNAGGWAFGGRIAFALGGFAINALVTRALVPADAARYFLLASLVAVSITPAQLGLPTAVVRAVAEALGVHNMARAAGAIRSSMSCGFFSALGVALVIGLAGPVVINAWTAVAVDRSGFALAGIWIAAMAFGTLLAEAYRGLHDNRAAAIFGGALSNLVSLVVLLLLTGLATNGLNAILLAICTGWSVNAVLASLTLRRRVRELGTPSEVPAGSMIALGWPLMITSFGIFITTQADLWIAASTLSAEQLALYAAAARLVQIVLLPMLIINAALQPFVAEFHGKGDLAGLQRLIRSAASAAGLIALAALAVLWLFSDGLLALAYGPFYAQGALVLFVLAAGQTVNILCGSAAVVMMMTGAGRSVMVISLACACGVLLAGSYAARTWGGTGLAVTAACATALHGLACMLWLFVVRRVKTLPDLAAAAAALRATWLAVQRGSAT